MISRTYKRPGVLPAPTLAIGSGGGEGGEGGEGG